MKPQKTKNEESTAAGKQRAAVLREGFRDGIPIGLGYFAVAFSLGIAARAAGLNAIEGLISSLLMNASAGEYVGFTIIGGNGTYLELALMTIIANARYLLMSCALSQRFSPSTSIIHRIGVGFYITDELFGISIARPGMLDPFYTYGAVLIASPCWGIGTALGVIAGNILPVRIVSALSVALYGMFIAIIIPPSRKNKVVAGAVLLSFVLSYISKYIPYVRDMSGGTVTIILTVLISSLAAFFFPIKDVDDSEGEDSHAA